MKTTSRLAFLLVAGALAVAGCGDDSGSEADTAAINDLVAGINRATAEQDGAAYCDLLQPSTFSDSFDSMGECARETNQILEQVGEQPALEVEDITVDGDTAEVSFAGRSGEAPFVKEEDSWYLSLGQGTAEPAEPDASSGSEEPGNGDTAGGGNADGG